MTNVEATQVTRIRDLRPSLGATDPLCTSNHVPMKSFCVDWRSSANIAASKFRDPVGESFHD